MLSGKRVDQDKGTVLKAEMAKKNLHIKRSTTTTTAAAATAAAAAASVSTSTSSTSTLNNNLLSTADIKPSSSSRGIYDNFSPLPSDLFQDFNSDMYNDSLLSSSTFNDSLFAIRSHSFDQDLGFISRFGLGPLQQQQQQQQHNNRQHMRMNFMNDTEADTLQYLSKSSQQHQELPPRMGSLSIQRTPNLADQNPPCNTLYVGNLSANTSEDELRDLFTNHKGYRRMCFRTKSQGPICFVEFEDVVCASQALDELQGHTLSNSIKGGIRLSFSKNPLFIKPAKENGSINFKQMGNTLNDNRRDFAFNPQL